MNKIVELMKTVETGKVLMPITNPDTVFTTTLTFVDGKCASVRKR